MARERKVTRTIRTEVASVLTVDTETLKVTEEIYYINGFDFRDEKDFEKFVQKMVQNDGKQFVCIKEHNYTEQLYVMTEATFMHCSKPSEK